MPRFAKYSNVVKVGAVDAYLLSKTARVEIWYQSSRYRFYVRAANARHQIVNSELIGVYYQADIDMLLEDLDHFMECGRYDEIDK